MKKYIKTVILGICGTLIFGACGTGSSTSEQKSREENEEKLIIGAALAAEDSSYMQLLVKHMEDAAQEKDVELIVEYAEWNVETQTRQMETFIEQKVDAVILCPVNAKSLLMPMKKVAKAGIPLINLNMKVDAISAEYITTYVGSSSSEEAALAADVFIERLGDKGGAIAIIEGNPGSDAQIYRTQTFVEQLTPYPDIEIVGVSNGGWDRDKSYLVTYDLLKRNPDLSGLYCQDCNMAMGAVKAIEELEMQEQVMVVGISDEEEYLKALEEGKLEAIISQPSEYEGKNAIYTAVMAANGEELRPWYKDPVQIITKEDMKN